MYYVVLTTFAPEVLGPFNFPKAIELMELAQAHHPNSCLFTYFYGRYYRQVRELDKSAEYFETIFSAKEPEATELADVCWTAMSRVASYELGLTFLFQLEFAKAEKHFGILADTGYWSPATLKYMQAACLEAIGKLDEAAKAYKQVTGLITRRFGGKVIASERYVLKRASRKVKGSWLPALELMAIWNGYTCMPLHLIQKCMEVTEKALQVGMLPEWLWIKGLLHKELAEYDAALETFNYHHTYYSDVVNGNNDCGLFLLPFIKYEEGVIYWLQNNMEAAKQKWNSASSHSGYLFEYR